VRVRGEATDPATPGGRLSGGTLGAHMTLRDETLPEIQARLDAFAADVARRLDTVSAGVLDVSSGTLAATDPGVAGRLEVASAVVSDPWRLRDGVSAAAPGAAKGDSSRLRGFAAALASADPDPDVHVPGAPTGSEPGAFAPGRRNASELLADVVSGVATARLSAESAGASHGAMAEVLRQEERAAGVDTDAELQKLMEIERGYAAGARVLQAVDDMLARILEI
jgi:flagellar hook-associated protein 1 FlgK